MKKRISLMKCTKKRITYEKQQAQETSFCICRKASMTVEAAVVIPIGMGMLLTILFFFRLLFIQVSVEEALLYTGRTLAVESCILDSEETLLASAELKMKYRLLQESRIKQYVAGGTFGVSLLGSEMSGNEIKLRANYIVKFPIEFFGKKGMWLTSANTFVKWQGDWDTKTENGVWVYITETGSVYHKDTACRSLDLSIQEINQKDISQLRGANGQKYYPCEKCMKAEQNTSLVYYTDYGRLYHGDFTCSALKRTILKVLLSEVSDRRPCSFCYK